MRTNNKNPIGSEWRKWDLHVHTPISIVQNYGGNTDANWEKFISDLESLPDEFKVIGINDYFFIDGYIKVLNYKKEGRLKNIDLILPVIEFRTSTFTGTDGRLKKINFHVIFADESLLKHEIIQQQFLNGLSSKFKLKPGVPGSQWSGIISQKSIKDFGAKIKSSVPSTELHKYGSDKEEGFNNLVVNEQDIYELLRSSYFSIENRRMYLTAIGKTEWDQLKWSDSSIALKKDTINSVDLIFSSSESIENYIKAKGKLEEQQVNSLLLDCSDAHYYSDVHEQKDRIGKCFTWLRSDPSFEGLKQILYEQDRIFVGDLPPKLKAIKKNPENFINVIKIKTSSDDNEWFDKVSEIPLNPSLVSIIGNKGSGKSALADILGSTGNANTEEFSFLKNDKFLKHPSKNKYEAEILFKDNYSATKSLINPQHIEKIPSKVIYFSQSFVNKLCDDEDTTRLQNEIARVIFSHIPNEERLNTNSLVDLIRKKTEAIDKRLIEERGKLNQISTQIISLEGLLNYPDKKNKIENLLKEKERLLKETRKNKPSDISKPTEGQNKEILEELNNKKEELQKNNENKLRSTKKLTNINNDIFELSGVADDIKEFQRKYDDLKKETIEKKTFINTHLDFEKIISINVDLHPLTEIIKKLKIAASKLDGEVKTFKKKIISLKKSIEELENKLTEKQRKYQKNIKDIENWKIKIKAIEGDNETKDSIIYLKKQIKFFEEELPKKFENIIEIRNKQSILILNLIEEKKNVYPYLFKYARIYSEAKAEEFSINLSDFLQFDSRYTLSNIFKTDFFDFINQKYAGTFHTLEKGNEQIEKILGKVNLNTINSILALPGKLIDALKKDFSVTPPKNTDYESQILENKKLEFYNFLFGFSYLNPSFNITYGGKVIDYLSPGEKGTLLLIFYLLIDKDKRPIIIDQPEDNLDNETVYKKLVKFIKSVKNDRQIIIVTHNPNLAIVCDSEQIIYCHINKDVNNLVQYTSASIENLEMRDAAINVLEGTKPAFNNRKNKYEIV